MPFYDKASMNLQPLTNASVRNSYLLFAKLTRDMAPKAMQWAASITIETVCCTLRDVETKQTMIVRSVF